MFCSKEHCRVGEAKESRKYVTQLDRSTDSSKKHNPGKTVLTPGSWYVPSQALSKQNTRDPYRKLAFISVCISSRHGFSFNAAPGTNPCQWRCRTTNPNSTSRHTQSAGSVAPPSMNIQRNLRDPHKEGGDRQQLGFAKMEQELLPKSNAGALLMWLVVKRRQ